MNDDAMTSDSETISIPSPGDIETATTAARRLEQWAQCVDGEDKVTLEQVPVFVADLRTVIAAALIAPSLPDADTHSFGPPQDAVIRGNWDDKEDPEGAVATEAAPETETAEEAT